MKTKIKNHPFLELFQSQEDEIMKYKWIESEKAGYDIGYERAAREWVQLHFNAWRQPRWNRLIVEALNSR